jgi:hypothetical protein
VRSVRGGAKFMRLLSFLARGGSGNRDSQSETVWTVRAVRAVAVAVKEAGIERAGAAVVAAAATTG